MCELGGQKKVNICDWIWTAIIENLINLLFRLSFSFSLLVASYSIIPLCSFHSFVKKNRTYNANKSSAGKCCFYTFECCSCPCLSTYNKYSLFGGFFLLLLFGCFLNFAFCSAFFFSRIFIIIFMYRMSGL